MTSDLFLIRASAGDPGTCGSPRQQALGAPVISRVHPRSAAPIGHAAGTAF